MPLNAPSPLWQWHCTPRATVQFAPLQLQLTHRSSDGNTDDEAAYERGPGQPYRWFPPRRSHEIGDVVVDMHMDETTLVTSPGYRRHKVPPPPKGKRKGKGAPPRRAAGGKGDDEGKDKGKGSGGGKGKGGRGGAQPYSHPSWRSRDAYD